MSHLTEMIAQIKDRDPQLGADLEREIKALSARCAFGLNFERHRLEAVELPGRPVRKGDKVRVRVCPRGARPRTTARVSGRSGPSRRLTGRGAADADRPGRRSGGGRRVPRHHLSRPDQHRPDRALRRQALLYRHNAENYLDL